MLLGWGQRNCKIRKGCDREGDDFLSTAMMNAINKKHEEREGNVGVG